MSRLITLSALTLMVGLAPPLAATSQSKTNTPATETSAADTTQRQFTFSWPFVKQGTMSPRGGTSKGPSVTLSPEPGAAWRALTTTDPISTFERDRRAILAMAGGYRTSFDFIETAGFTADHKPDRPYQSWTTEFVTVAEDTGPYISLQHIIVMYFAKDDGGVSEPMVVKHWRQDWRFEDRDLHVYDGFRRWRRIELSAEDSAQSWTQAVFQVDDSPRYEATGKWVHYANYSSWESNQTWRPLPRREFSVRKDYQVLAGTNRHTITPFGWVQEEDNLKLVINPDERAAKPRVLAREIGLNRYERIVDHHFVPGDVYWKATQGFWKQVRVAWQQVYAARNTFKLKAKFEDRRMFEWMFGYARKLVHGEPYDEAAAEQFIQATLAGFLE